MFGEANDLKGRDLSPPFYCCVFHKFSPLNATSLIIISHEFNSSSITAHHPLHPSKKILSSISAANLGYKKGSAMQILFYIC